MKEQEVTDYMKAATSEADWDDRADEVKRRCDGYPSFWYMTIVVSGLMNQVVQSWDKS